MLRAEIWRAKLEKGNLGKKIDIGIGIGIGRGTSASFCM